MTPIYRRRKTDRQPSREAMLESQRNLLEQEVQRLQEEIKRLRQAWDEPTKPAELTA